MFGIHVLQDYFELIYRLISIELIKYIIYFNVERC